MSESRVARDRVTLADIAAAGGVSVPTVSKVLNGHADVAPKTRSRVEALLADYNDAAPGARDGHASSTGYSTTSARGPSGSSAAEHPAAAEEPPDRDPVVPAGPHGAMAEPASQASLTALSPPRSRSTVGVTAPRPRDFRHYHGGSHPASMTSLVSSVHGGAHGHQAT